MLTLYIDKLDMVHLAKLQALLNQAITVRHSDKNTVEIMQNGQVQARLVCPAQAQHEPNRLLARLTPKQKQVLALLGQALKNQEIGQALQISEKTVEKPVSIILHKLELKSRSQAALVVMRMGDNYRSIEIEQGFSPPGRRENLPKL